MHIRVSVTQPHSDPPTLNHINYIDTMADESVPQPYPNLQVPTWQYQVTSVPSLKDEASTSFWKAVEEDG